MRSTYEIDTARGIAFWAIAVVFNLEEVIDGVDTLLDDPDWRPGFHQLVDFSAVENMDVSSDDLRAISRNAKSKANRIGQGRLAIVAPEDVTFGVMRMFQTFADEDPRAINIFRNRESALLWLETGR